MPRKRKQRQQGNQTNIAGNVTGNVLSGTFGQVNIAALPSAPSLHQLRTPVGDFKGRSEEITNLIDALCSNTNTTVAISGVRGMGGIGKTELAYAVAQRLTTIFPDAQLEINLGGSSSSPLTTIQALRTLIWALLPDLKQLPEIENTLQHIYHSALHDKRALILADDAQNASQVRPLTPPAGCALLITSRQRFTLPHIHIINLEELSESESIALLQDICDRISHEQAQTIARLCGYLPLALRVSSGILANDPSLGVERYLTKLTDERNRLAALRDPDDPNLDVAAALELSYQALDTATQQALAQFGVFAGGWDLIAAQAVLDFPENRSVEDTLSHLVRRNLVSYDENQQRYTLHELVRIFALEHLENENVRWWHALHYAWVAMKAEDLYIRIDGNKKEALALFDRERMNIDTGIKWAQSAGREEADKLLIEYVESTTIIGHIRYASLSERIPQLEAAKRVYERLGQVDPFEM